MWELVLPWLKSSHQQRPIQRAGNLRKSTRFVMALGFLLMAISAVLAIHLITAFRTLPRALHLEQRCRMSRMWPSYQRYDIPSSTGLDAKYHLFLYREAPPSSTPPPPSGRPVLFVPGNAGSYGQVRSLASSTHHLFERGEGVPSSGPGAREPDWWAVHFNEDFSAFHGETLREEARYLNDALAFLLALYPGTGDIPIVAHSMGGIAARLAILQPNHPPNSIKTMVTLSSPHAYPPVPLERDIDAIYAQLRSETSKSSAEKDILLISLSGGILDDQLSSEASVLDLARLWSANTSLHAFTGSLAGLWSGVDHLAMMWCDQLRERVARGILRIESHGKDLAARRHEWARMLGMENAAAESIAKNSPQVNMAPHNQMTDEEDRSLQTLRVPSREQYSHFEVITSLNVGIDASFGPPVEQKTQLRVLFCRPSSESSSQQCDALLPSAYDVLPPSPPAPGNAIQKPFPAFPQAEMRYELPGNALRRAVVTAEQLAILGVTEIRIMRWPQQGSVLHAGFLKTSDRVQQLAGSGSAPFDVKLPTPGSALTKEAIVMGLDSTLLAYDVSVASSAAKDACEAERVASPMLRVESLSTRDTQYLPSLQNGVTYTFMLHGTSPYMQPARQMLRGTKFSVVLDACSRVENIHVKINKKASVGLLLSRYRTAVVAMPFTVVLAVTALMWRQWDEAETFPALTPSIVIHSISLLPALALVMVVASIIQKVWFSLWTTSEGALPDNISALTFGTPISPLWSEVLLTVVFLIMACGLALVASLAIDAVVLSCATILERTGYRSANPAQFASNSKPQTPKIPKGMLAGFAVLTVLIYTMIPVQFINLALFVVQLSSAILSEQQAKVAQPSKQDSNHSRDRANQHRLILNFFFWLLPLNAPALIIWSRNLLNGWYETLGGSDHNILTTIGFLLVAHSCSSGHLLPRSSSGFTSTITTALMLKSLLLCAALGLRRTYLIYNESNLLFIWLASLRMQAHLFADRSLASKAQHTAYRVDDTSEQDNLLSTSAANYSQLPKEVEFSMPLPASIASSMKQNEHIDAYEIPGDELAGEVIEPKIKTRTRLDRLLEEYLAAVDVYLEHRRIVSDRLGQGFYQMSKARIQLGQVRISEAWDARMRAVLGIEVDPASGAMSLSREFRPNDEKAGPMDSQRRRQGVLGAREGLRRRRDHASPGNILIKDDDEARETSEKETADVNKKGQLGAMPSSDTRARKPAPYDPLYQFSALPPPSLRHAQFHFVAALGAAAGTILPDQGRNENSLTASQLLGIVNVQRELKRLESDIATERARAEEHLST